MKLTRIRIRGNGVVFPKMCPCCGEAADTSFQEMSSTRSGNVRTTTTLEMPHCTACLGHMKKFRRFAIVPGASGIHILLIALTIGLYYIVWRIVFFPKAKAAAVERQRVNNEGAKKLMKPSCTDAGHIFYTYDMKEKQHIFELRNAKYMQALMAANKEALVAPDEVKAMLPA